MQRYLWLGCIGSNAHGFMFGSLALATGIIDNLDHSFLTRVNGCFGIVRRRTSAACLYVADDQRLRTGVFKCKIMGNLLALHERFISQ